jgi:hypothetical protein
MFRVSYKFLLFGIFVIVLSACLDRSSRPSKENTAVAAFVDIQTPLPPYLRLVYPKPGSQTTRAAYTTGIEDEENRLFDQLHGAICVDLIQASLLEQNDRNLDSEDFVAGSHLRVGTFGSSSYDIPVRHDRIWVSESGGVLVDEKGNTIGASLIACWMADLSPGVYEAIYEYTRTSGSVLSYTWSFEIVE